MAKGSNYAQGAISCSPCLISETDTELFLKGNIKSLNDACITFPQKKTSLHFHFLLASVSYFNPQSCNKDDSLGEKKKVI